jgi:hypothetical protein
MRPGKKTELEKNKGTETQKQREDRIVVVRKEYGHNIRQGVVTGRGQREIQPQR